MCIVLILNLIISQSFSDSLLLVIKIILPLIIIILASIDFFKAVMSGKDSDITASLKGVLWRFVSALIV